jgi:hypothetical protein
LTTAGCTRKEEIIWFAPITGNDKGPEWSPNYLLKPEIRREIILGFHFGKTKKEIAKKLEISEDSLQSEIDLLYQKDLLTTVEGKTRPYMLVLLPEDLPVVEEACKGVADEIIDFLSDKWSLIDSAIFTMSPSSRFDNKRLRFEIVGCYVLDLGLLYVFNNDAELIPPPPKKAGGEYYAFFIQGPKKDIKNITEGYGATGTAKLCNGTTYYPVYFCPTPKQERLRARLFQNEEGKYLEEEKLCRFFNEYERYYHTSDYQLNEEVQKFLIRAGYVDESGKTLAPIYKEQDIEKIDSLIIPLDLKILQIFKNKKDDFKKAYLRTSAGVYPTKTEEANFINRCLHLVFSDVIRKLMAEGMLAPHEEGDSDYWLEKHGEATSNP